MQAMTLITMTALCLFTGVTLAASPCDALPTTAPVFETRKMPGALIDAQCNASTLPGLPAAVRSGTPVPGGELRFADDGHAQCELFSNNRGTGRFKLATVCATGSTRVEDRGIWRCRGVDRLEKVQVGASNPRQACEQARAGSLTGSIPTPAGAPGMDAVRAPKQLPGREMTTPAGSSLGPPDLPRPDLTIVAVREVDLSTEVEVTIRNVGNAPNLNSCYLNSRTSFYDIGVSGPDKWQPAGCRGGQNVPIKTIAPGNEKSLRICGYSPAEIDRDTGQSVSITIDRECDPQRDGNNVFSYRRELSPEAYRREYCAAHRGDPECRR